ncbi:MAG TPA: MFS transporter [Pusillimonas sp.]|uniref:MFS transporter n=1 Tax=unclassified Pusillimonas TaxID=2640016 RepID=UPI00262539C1|nr:MULTISPECIES: MFS transporter [unclassified Pusillimonas]HLU20374.1 MFS transporter [Pusillimonas sp.]
MKLSAWAPFAALTAVASLGLAIFFTLYSLIPVTRADAPGLSSLFLGTMMGCVMLVQALTPILVSRFSLRLVLGGSMVLTAIGAVITGFSVSTPALLSGAVAAGAGFGVLIVAGSQGIALLVPESRLGRMIGIYGLVTMASAALGSPLGVQLALTFSPSAFGLAAVIIGVLAVCLSFGIPGAVGKRQDGGHGQQSVNSTERCQSGLVNRLQMMGKALAEAPWLVLGFLIVGVALLSHGLSSMPVITSSYVSAAVVIFSVQAGNALGRWLGGELEARSTTGITVITAALLLAAGGILGVVTTSSVLIVLAGVLIGVGVGVVQTVTLHTAMRLMSSGRASVLWNLSVDAGLWTGGIVWGVALTSSVVVAGVFVLSVLILMTGVALVVQLKQLFPQP